MQRRKKSFTFLASSDYTKLYIRIYEAISGQTLTPREIDVLAAFLSFDGYVAKISRFSRSFRKQVMKDLKMSPAQMSNILTDLQKKEVLLKDEAGELYVDPVYVPPADGIEINLTLHAFNEATA